MKNKIKPKHFLPYSRQNLDNRDIYEVTKVLKSDFITQGPKILEFEKNFANYVKSKYAVACATGTAALHIACQSLGLSKGDNLITSPITFVASANCAQFLGANTLFADVNKENFCICPNALEKVLKTEKIDVVVVVHMAGYAADLKKINFLKKKYDFKIIEDACHALGGKYKDKKIGSCFYSDISTFSFHPVKPITTGEGGMVTTNDINIYKRLLKFRTHGIHNNSKDFLNKDMAFDKKGNVNMWYYEMSDLGYNYRITDIQAALGNSQLRKIDKFIKQRTNIAKLYDSGFKKNNFIKIPKVSPMIKHAYHLYTILIDFKAIKKSRNEIMLQLKKLNIGTQVLYIPVHLQPYYFKKYNFKKRNFPNSEDYYNNCLSIPIFPGMKKNEVKYVIETINNLVRL
jgi:UDP-4-amino-4,6-dideoxy-N-acetyl-beta-L-altrosamine transaminase|tara:strand:- start:1218 stop:2420 length:1203 start_codon:yes stop_codon:yes gene_type:complete